MDIKKLKEINEEGKLVAIIEDNGEEKESIIDVHDTLSKLSTVNAESASRRIRLKEVEAELETLKAEKEKIKGKKIIDPDEEKAKETIINKNWKEKVEGLESNINEKDELIRKLTIGSKFNVSDYINKNTILTGDIAESYLGKNFSVNEKGEIIAKKNDKTPIMSKANPEQYAGFEEAIEILISEMPNKDKILKAPSSGDGLKGSNISGNYEFNHIKNIKDFKSTSEKAAYIKKYGLEAFKKLSNK